MMGEDLISQERDITSNMQDNINGNGVLLQKEKRSITPKKKKNQIIINNQYVVQECIYKGKFYNTYKGYSKEEKKNVVIKMCNQYHAHISDELKIMKHLQNVSPIWVGEEKIFGVNYQVKILKQMGPSLKIVFGLQNYTFQIHTVFLIALNLILSVENLHKHDIVHRNLRPRKIITDFNLKLLNLYLVDYKNAKKFRHKSGQTMRYTESNRQQNKSFANKFSSLGVHMGISPCQKDDLESIGYILVYFLKRGKLFLKKKQYINHEEKINHYEEQKLNFVAENYKDIIPQEIISYITYVKMLNQQDKIDYDYIKKLIRGGLSRLNINLHEQRYEWSEKIKQDLKTFSKQQNEGQILSQQMYDLSSRMPQSERGGQDNHSSFQQDIISHQAQGIDLDRLELHNQAQSLEIKKKDSSNTNTNTNITKNTNTNNNNNANNNFININNNKLNDSFEQSNNINNNNNKITNQTNTTTMTINTNPPINSQNNINNNNNNNNQNINDINTSLSQQLNYSFNNTNNNANNANNSNNINNTTTTTINNNNATKETQQQQGSNGVRVVIGSQIDVVGDEEKYDTDVGEKYDYQAFLRMNSTDEKNLVRLSSQTLESQFLKDPFQRQASNLSKHSERSLFSRFNSKSFEEGISDEITTQHPSLANQIKQLGGGINPLNMFTASKRNKYFGNNDGSSNNNNNGHHGHHGHSIFKKNNSQIDEVVEEYSEVQVNNQEDNYYKIEND